MDALAPERLVPLEAVHNFRDIGGYLGQSGLSVKMGVLYRADGLYRLTASDIEVIRALGVQTVIDLRSAEELHNVGTFPQDAIEVNFHHVPIIDSTWQQSDVPDFDEDTDFLMWAYTQMLSEGAAQFQRAFSIISDWPQMPLVYHCAAGKDRTGLLTMLLLGVLGVDDDVIVRDYALSEPAMLRMMEWARTEYPDFETRTSASPKHFLSANPRAMTNLIQMLREEHGDFNGIAASLGITETAIESLKSMMLIAN